MEMIGRRLQKAIYSTTRGRCRYHFAISTSERSSCVFLAIAPLRVPVGGIVSAPIRAVMFAGLAMSTQMGPTGAI